MRNFSETYEAIRANDARYTQFLDEGEAAGSAIGRRRRGRASVAEMEQAVQFVHDVERGNISRNRFAEVMTTSDFPLIFGDTLDRQLLGQYRATVPEWRQLFRISRVPDFRNVKRMASDGGDGQLEFVAEATEYPAASLDESGDEYAVAKFGRRIPLTWEAMINDDLGIFDGLPDRLARGAIRSEERFATSLLFDGNGPSATLFNAPFDNIIPGNPPLSTAPDGIAALQAGFDQLATAVDPQGEPIVFELVYLVVPPALEQIGRNLLNASQLWLANPSGGSQLVVDNWMRNRVRLVVLPYIPSIVTTTPANASTSWLLMGSPADGRPVVEFGFLRNFDAPALFTKAPTARYIGGGDAMESFDDDTFEWKVRHVFGGAQLLNTSQGRGAVASNGTGEDS